MECPRCGAKSPRPPASCTACGLDLDSLTASLGSNLVKLGSLNDVAHCLRVREREALVHELESFHQMFPQVFLAVYLGVLPTSPSASEIAFWLLNHAAFHPGDAARLNERAIMLIIDPVAKTAGLNVGYALEGILTGDKLLSILRRIRTPLWHGEYGGAIGLAITLLGKDLRRAARRKVRQAEFPPPDPEAGFLPGSGLHSLRDTTANPTPNQRREE